MESHECTGTLSGAYMHIAGIASDEADSLSLALRAFHWLTLPKRKATSERVLLGKSVHTHRRTVHLEALYVSGISYIIFQRIQEECSCHFQLFHLLLAIKSISLMDWRSCSHHPSYLKDFAIHFTSFLPINFLWPLISFWHLLRGSVLLRGKLKKKVNPVLGKSRWVLLLIYIKAWIPIEKTINI